MQGVGLAPNPAGEQRKDPFGRDSFSMKMSCEETNPGGTLAGVNFPS